MRKLTVSIVAGLLLAGCSGGTEEPAAPEAAAGELAETAADLADTSECDLLTDAEVSQAIGATVASHESSGLSGCTWTAEGNAQLMFDLYSGSSLSSGTCDAQKKLGTGKEEAISGLGDSALWKSSGWLVACSSRAVMSFNLDNSKQTGAQDKEGLVALARSALGRL
jgi:hypothetical protein